MKDMEAGRNRVAGTDRVVRDVSRSLNVIIELVQELSNKSREVAVAATQVGIAIQNVSASSEEQTASMEEVTASTVTLARLSEELNSTVRRF